MSVDIIARALALAATPVAATAAAISNLKLAPSVGIIQTSGYDVAGSGAGLYVSDSLANAALALAHPRFCKADGSSPTRYWRLVPVNGAIPADAALAASDIDETAAVLAASAYALVLGLTWVGLSPERVWRLKSQDAVAQLGLSAANADYLSVYPGVFIRTNGATLRGLAGAYGAVRGLDYRGKFLAAPNFITAAHAAGATTVTVTNASLIPVGSWVLYRFGDVAYDIPETYTSGIAQVTARNTGANTITLDRAMPRAFTAPELAAAVLNRHVSVIDPIIDVDFGDARFDQALTGGYTGCEHAVVIKQALNCTFGSVGGKGLHVGAFIAQYAYGWHVEQIFNHGSRNTSADTGNGARFAEAQGTIGKIVTYDCDRTCFAAEGGSLLHFGEIWDDNNGATSNRKVIVLNGRSHVTADKTILTGAGAQMLADQIDSSSFATKHLHIRTSAMPSFGGRIGQEITESLTLEVAGAVPERYTLAKGHWIEQRIDLTGSMAGYVRFGVKNRLVGKIEVFASSGVAFTAGKMNYLQAVRYGGSIATSLAAYTVAGQWNKMEGQIDNNTNNVNFAERDQELAIYVDTQSGTALVGEFLIVRLFVIENENAATGATSGNAEAATFMPRDGTVARQDASAVAITGGTIALASGSLGYAVGAGGTIVQATSKATGVTLNKAAGQITMDAASLAAATSAAFTLTNSAIAANDEVRVWIKSGATTNSYTAQVENVAAGSCRISLRNYTAGALAEAVVLGFSVYKAAIA